MRTRRFLLRSIHDGWPIAVILMLKCIPVSSFQPQPLRTRHVFQISPFVRLLQARRSEDEETDEQRQEEDEEDWRDFRAKLVLQEQRNQGERTSSLSDDSSVSVGGMSSSSSWAYESGRTIEKGSVILSRAQQDFGHHGLSQQYFHKCVILVIHHDDESTKGVILNRPTDLLLSDDDFMNDDGSPVENATSEDSHWKVWYGGDVQGIQSEEPEVICLHSITSPEANKISEKILKNIQWTTLAGAHKLVRDGHCQPEDFYIICGYAGWGPGQLMDELERESWFMAATDSQTLLMELRKEDQDPRDAGLETWNKLMERIGKAANQTSQNNSSSFPESFGDLMLREWAREELLLADKEDQGRNNKDNVENMFQLAESVLRDGDIRVGKILRASASRQHPPFLLDDQEFHRSLVLIIQDDQAATVGVVLNLPSDQVLELEVLDATPIPVRFGGRYGVKGQSEKPFIWLHGNDALRKARVGAPLLIGNDDDDEDAAGAIWICTQEDAEVAVRMGLASSTDFMVIGGFSVWPKGKGTVGGILGEVLEGKFEPVDNDKVQEAWDTLIKKQEVASAENIDEMLSVARSAWTVLGRDKESSFSLQYTGDNKKKTSDTFYKSGTPAVELVDAALRTWVATFLLSDKG